jgi:hypothetical protein
MKPLAQSMMPPLKFSRYAMLSERSSTIFKYNGVIHWFETQSIPGSCQQRGNINLLCDCGLSYCTAPLPMWRPSFQSGLCVALVLLSEKLATVAVVAMKRKVSANCQLSKNGSPGRDDSSRIGTGLALRHRSGQRHLNTGIHLLPINSGPCSLTPPQLHHACTSPPLNRSFTCR